MQRLPWMRETTESFGLVGREGAVFLYGKLINLLEALSLRTRSAVCLFLRFISTVRARSAGAKWSFRSRYSDQ